MKKGFSLLTALIFLILVATISTLAITLSTLSTKQTTDIYLKSQAELLLRSGTEFAMLAISGTDYNSTNCNDNTINMTYNKTYDINISIFYIGSGLGVCSKVLANDINTSDSNRTVIINTTVSTRPDITTEPIRLFRRTIQKP